MPVSHYVMFIYGCNLTVDIYEANYKFRTPWILRFNYYRQNCNKWWNWLAYCHPQISL
jgi:hypothetical protein